MENLIHDVRVTLRQLRSSPGFALIAILSLALGIGANTTIFSAAHGILERELPVRDADQLARVYRGDHSPLPLAEFLALAETTESFSALMAERVIRVGLTSEERTEAVQAALVSPNYFAGLGIGAQRGRTFSGAIGSTTGPEVLLSDRYWRARFGADPSIVGRTLRLADQTFTVIGVVDATWVSSQSWRPDIFVPMSEHAALLGVAPGEWNGSVYVTGRLAADRTRAQANAEIEALVSALYPDAAEPLRYSVTPAKGLPEEVRGQATIASIFLLALVELVLLIACANVANLLLARTAFRGREIAIRLALGVTRGRLVRQLLTESVVLAAVAGIAAIAVAAAATRFLGSLLPADLPIHFDITPDTSVLIFAAGISLFTGLVCGLAPALRSSRSDLQTTLRQDTSRSGYRSRLRSGFLIAQVSLGTVLLTGAVLFARSLSNANDMDPGFRTQGIVDLPIDVSLRSYDEARGQAYYDEVLARTRSTPGVQHAALANIIPLSGSNRAAPVQPGEADPDDRAAFVQAHFNSVTPDYFATLDIELRAGRDFTADDDAAAPAVAIINDAAAAALWPGESPLGKVLRIWDDGMPELVVVGVAADAKYNTLGEGNTPFVYLSANQDYHADMVLHARVDDGAGSAVRDAALSVDPALPLDFVRPIADDMSFAFAAARIGAGLLGTFAFLAMLLASVGIYGVTSWMVTKRTPEIGVRSALGAQPIDVLRLVMGETMRTVAIGLVLGIAGGAALARIVSSQLYGVAAIDPLTFTVTPAVLLAVAALATWLPARRAVSIDPVKALGRE